MWNLENRDSLFLMNKILPSVMEYGIYLLVVFLFTGRGETFRNIGLYVPAFALVVRVWITRQISSGWKEPLLILIVMLCISAALSSLFAEEPLASLNELKKTYLKVLIIFLVTVTVFNRVGPLKRMLFLLSALALFFTVMTFYDYLTKAITGDGHITYDNVRVYSEILPFLLPFVPFSILTARRAVFKIFWALTLCVGVSALLLTGFRGGWLSMSVSLLIWGVWELKRRVSVRPLLILLGALVSAAVILTVLPSSHIVKRLQEGISTTGRYEWRWKAYIQMYNEFPIVNKLLGKGLPKEIMFEAYSAWYMQKTGSYPDTDMRVWPRNPHNNYLALLFRQGIIGLILFVTLIITSIRLITTAVKKQSTLEYKAIGVAILCPLVGEYVVRSLVEDMRFMPLGLLLGLAGSYLSLRDESKEDMGE